jgi:hypothetical protein
METDLSAKLEIINKAFQNSIGVYNIELLDKHGYENNVKLKFYFMPKYDNNVKLKFHVRYDHGKDSVHLYEFNKKHIEYLLDILYNISMQEIKMHTLGLSQNVHIEIQSHPLNYVASNIKEGIDACMMFESITDNILYDYENRKPYILSVVKTSGNVEINERNNLITFYRNGSHDNVEIKDPNCVFLNELFNSGLVILKTTKNNPAECLQIQEQSLFRSSYNVMSKLLESRSNITLPTKSMYRLVKYYQLLVMNNLREVLLISGKTGELSSLYGSISTRNNISQLIEYVTNWYEKEQDNQYRYVVNLDCRTNVSKYIQLTQLYDSYISAKYIEPAQDGTTQDIKVKSRALSSLARAKGLDKKLNFGNNDNENYQIIDQLTIDEQAELFNNISITRSVSNNSYDISEDYKKYIKYTGISTETFAKNLNKQGIITETEYADILSRGILLWNDPVELSKNSRIYEEIQGINNMVDELIKYIK